MLRWTAAGAVSAPTTVQIRLSWHHPAGIRAGAPAPTRGMSTAEVEDNLRWFTAGMRTPRARPCTALVLSGEGVARRTDLDALFTLARAEGIVRFVLHAGADELSALPDAGWPGSDTSLVVALPPRSDLPAAALALQRARRAGLRVATNTVLDAEALPLLDRLVDLLAAPIPGPHTFTFPFPTGPVAIAQAPPPMDAVRALLPALDRLVAAGVEVQVKGLPACYLGRHGGLHRRTANRWYVDADHQRDRALLFFPEVVAFHKAEACRFCAIADACDGFFTAWLDRGDAPPLTPVEG